MKVSVEVFQVAEIIASLQRSAYSQTFVYNYSVVVGAV